MFAKQNLKTFLPGIKLASSSHLGDVNLCKNIESYFLTGNDNSM